MTLQDAIQELYFWQRSSNPTNFHARLYDLIGKADSHNRERLRAGFPEEVEAFERWQRAENEKAFFEAWIKSEV